MCFSPHVVSPHTENEIVFLDSQELALRLRRRFETGAVKRAGQEDPHAVLEVRKEPCIWLLPGGLGVEGGEWPFPPPPRFCVFCGVDLCELVRGVIDRPCSPHV